VKVLLQDESIKPSIKSEHASSVKPRCNLSRNAVVTGYLEDVAVLGVPAGLLFPVKQGRRESD
jgi:hypothetical protein